MAFPFPDDVRAALSGAFAGVKKAASLRRPSGELARRRASIAPNQLAWDGTFVAFTRLHLKAWANAPTERDRTNSPRQSGGGKSSSAKYHARPRARSGLGMGSLRFGGRRDGRVHHEGDDGGGLGNEFVQEFDAFGGEHAAGQAHAREIAAWPIEAANETRGPTRIDADYKQTRLESS
jgi:hypothetical protein